MNTYCINKMTLSSNLSMIMLQRDCLVFRMEFSLDAVIPHPRKVLFVNGVFYFLSLEHYKNLLAQTFRLCASVKSVINSVLNIDEFNCLVS